MQVGSSDASDIPLEAPWLEAPLLQLAAALERGHRLAFGVPLLPVAERSARQLAQELFAGPEVLLAHDGSADPRLVYANRAALRLWRRPWRQMVGLPSRLTAEAEERPARALALAEARSQRGIRGYGGIRIDSQGRRFRLQGARIWSPIDSEDKTWGQAAAFESWWWL
jgi:hypothetical protein